MASRETGGWAFSFAGAGAGAWFFGELGAGFGIVTGPGAVVTAALGGLVGGILGFFGGEKIAEGIYNEIEPIKDIPELVRDTPTFLETFIMMFGSKEAKRQWIEAKETLTGEESIWDSF